jgi:hypothetical protein
VKQLPHTELTSSILELLGPKFVEEYLQNEQSFALDSLPQSPADEKDLQKQAESWLNDKLGKIIKDLKLKSCDYTEVEEEELSMDSLEYIRFGQQVVYRGMERELSSVKKRHHDVVNEMFKFTFCQITAVKQKAKIIM